MKTDVKTNINADALTSEISGVQTWKPEDVTPKDLLKFAKTILFCIFGMAVIGVICEYFTPSNNIFPALREILPPMATMVIGFYFGKST